MSNDLDLKWWDWVLGPFSPERIATIIVRFILKGILKHSVDIILYGPMSAGKTTFYKFLKSGFQELVDHHVLTLDVEESRLNNEMIMQYTNSQGKTIQFRDLKDFPGKLDWLNNIEEEIKNGLPIIYIVYFIALPMIIEEDLEIDEKKKEKIDLFREDYSYNYTKNVESDLRYIQEKVEEYKKAQRVHILIIFNFADLYPLYLEDKSLFKKKIEKYIDNWIVRAGGYNKVGYVIGSLANKQEAENLLKETLKKIIERTNSSNGR